MRRQGSRPPLVALYEACLPCCLVALGAVVLFVAFGFGGMALESR